MLLDLDQDDVLVAVGADRLDVLHVSAAFALEPEFVTASAEEVGFAGFDRLGERVLVHPGHHQYLAGLVILDDGGDQAVGIVLEVFEGGVHWERSCRLPVAAGQRPARV